MTTAEQTRLYTEYRDRVLGYIRSRVPNREDAEDLCEDVFLKVLRASGSYDDRRSAPGTWIYAITRNTVIDYFRRTRPTEELPEDLAEDALPEDGLMQTELLDSLAEALERLPEELTDIVVLHYYDRLPMTEISLRLGLSYGVVKLRHQKALNLLRRSLLA
ncbi:MAG: sigma-70 family RNA polymerase sigma factor [Oscillospiraceae bacterium]|nr:sigma-70 family RNA polymerase sigma factor [Oscillospiraceae bacterium]